MKNKLHGILGLLVLLTMVSASVAGLEGSRMLGRAGAGVALSGEQDAIFGNAAGLAGVQQSFLEQTYSQTGADRTFSQSFVLAIAESTAFGGLVNLQMDNATEKVCAFPSLSGSTRLFNFISLGVNVNKICSKPVYSVGAVAGFKASESHVAVLEAGIYHENVKGDLFFDRENFSRPLTGKATAGGHLRLKTDDGAFIDVMFDTVYLNNFKEVPFSKSTKKAALEQTYHLGGSSSLSMRTGMELPTTGAAIYSVGLGWKSGFLSVDAGMRMNQKEDDHFAISATFLLADKGNKSPVVALSKMTAAAVKTESVKPVRPSRLMFGNSFNSLKCSILPTQGLNDGKMGFVIDIKDQEDIGTWMVHLIDMNSLKIVKIYKGDGNPPAAFQINMDSLPNSKYRADFSCVTKDLSQTGSSESAFLKNETEIVASAKLSE